MSYAMTHLIIANEFCKKIPMKEKDFFYLASIAPDSVHARNDYQPELKASSHSLQKEEKWGEIYEEEPLKIWYEHVSRFYKERCKFVHNEKEQAFLQGYTLHILVDLFNCSLLYAPNLIRYGLDVIPFRNDYRKECIIQDAYLFQNYADTKDIEASLLRSLKFDLQPDILEHLQLDSFITATNIEINVQNQIEIFHSAAPASLEHLKLLSIERSNQFLKNVEEQCERILFNFPEVGRTFQIHEI